MRFINSKTFVILHTVLLAACLETAALAASPIDQNLILGVWYSEQSDLKGKVQTYTDFRKDGTYRAIAALHSSHYDGLRGRDYQYGGTWKIVGKKLLLDGPIPGGSVFGKNRNTIKIISLTKNTFVFRSSFKEKMEKVPWLQESAKVSQAGIVLKIFGVSVSTTPAKIHPRVIIWEDPMYPKNLHNTGIKGSVLVQFLIEPNGYPSEIVAAKATNNDFAQAAVEAISKWRYEPAQLEDGSYIASRGRQEILFNP